MSSAPPSKKWMDAHRLSTEYLEGVASFIKFTKDNSDDSSYCCPCNDCRNYSKPKTSIEIISEHLICNGIDKSYRTWVNHGEQPRRSSVNSRVPSSSVSDCNEGAIPRMEDLFSDTFRHVNPGHIDECLNDTFSQNETQVQDDALVNRNYNKEFEDAMQPIYPSCQGHHTKLSVTVELLSMKARHQFSEGCLTELLQFMKKLLPDGNTLPECVKPAKDIIVPFRMKYEIIHACPKDCILYWREHSNKDECPKSGESRWKQMENSESRSKRIPRKKLRYFPITERLQQMYNVPWIAENMKWHHRAEENGTGTYVRHPVDSARWKQIDSLWREFAAEKRNVRLGLATDGFNPFGMNNSYSCWPVMIVPYNLPPSLCMIKEFTMLTLLIPGPSGPGHNIDVYMQPLIAELNELWSVGSLTYDSHMKDYFTMKAILLWCIHDYPAFGHLSGCRTAGRYGCVVCGEQTDSVWLKYGNKFAYMGHRRFLDEKHYFRKKKSQFNGKEDHRKAPRRLSAPELFHKMQTIHTEYGKEANKKRKRDNDEEFTAWSKRSILHDLHYAKDLPIHHNVDVMHVEKNVTENLIGTIMDIKGKSKDGFEARKDLKEMKIKKKLWLVEKNGKVSCPEAPFSLSRSEKEIICKTLHKLKVPIGYSGNWKHKVCLQELQFKGLKSHDYHILMQGLLPVFLMHSFKKYKPLRAAIKQLSLFFKIICSKVVSRLELTNMRKKIIETLCVFEMYFPPSFFVSMTHLVVHLAEEAQLCGPLRYRWMYPFERMMKTYKRYGRNKTFIEGSIAEQYMLEEAMRYCMEYILDGKKKSYTRGGRTFIDIDDEHPHPINSNGKAYHLSHLQYEQARKWVLKHSPENAEWEEKYESYLRGQKSTGKNQRGNQQMRNKINYIPWLKQQLEKEVTNHFKRLVDGPDFDALTYNAYAVNGYVFYTAHSEMNMTTQNCGVAMNAITSFRASAKDKNLVEEEVTYYGIVRQILELNYFDFKQMVFYCDWVRIEDKVNGCVVDPQTNLAFVNLGRFKRNSSEDDEPFILASQATQQVFYCQDETRENWHLVFESPKKLSHDSDTFEDPLVFEARSGEDALRPLLLDDSLEDNED